MYCRIKINQSGNQITIKGNLLVGEGSRRGTYSIYKLVQLLVEYQWLQICWTQMMTPLDYGT